LNSIKSLMQPSIVYLQEKQVKKGYSKKGQITDMNIFNFSVPQDITVGKGSLAKLPEIAKKLGGSHAFIISGPHLAKMGLVEKAADYLKTVDIKTDAFTEIEANPSVATVEKATEKFKESGADFIVAFGGGSPMDVAKAVGVVAKYGGSITEYEGAHKVPGPIIPLIAIPTTAGTGSEVTAFSVITDHSRDYKLTVFSYELLPAYAILDAELITTAPASVAAACGIDAFIHAEEAYISTAASPFSDAMAEKAMALIGKNIRRFVANRGDMEAAEAMMVGSLFAGIAFSFARLGNVHAMSHPVSAFFDVPHGVANAVLLPVVAEYNALADHGRYLTIYNVISPVPAYTDDFEPMMLVDAIHSLCADIGIPENLTIAINQASKTGEVTREEIESKIEAMAVDAMKSGNIAVNPRSSRQCDIEMLYKKAL
jgi:alcohol dehydrogenase